MVKAQHLKLGSIEAVKHVLKEGWPVAIVWANEGKFTKSEFIFNKEHSGYEPLILDVFSASAINGVYEVVGQDKKEKIAETLAESRDSFMQFMSFSWRANF